jgi:hypothetical protein
MSVRHAWLDNPWGKEGAVVLDGSGAKTRLSGHSPVPGTLSHAWPAAHLSFRPQAALPFLPEI